jgi:hypothetical protein|tara:strand:+ start:255 stop:893 length:639 start_codon:yes stop_codon:yes gene_type:complete
MKFYLKGKNVIKLKSIFASILFLVSASYLSGQSAIDKATAKLIQDVIIHQDSTLKEFNRKLLLEKFSKNEVSAADTTAYFSFVKKQKLNLSSNYDNTELEYYLEKELKDDNQKVLSLIGINRNQLSKIIAKIKKTKKTKIPKIFNKIEIIDAPNQNNPIHSFSSPFKIRDTIYLIFHGKYNSPLNSFGELFIFKILKNCDYCIEKTIPLYIS